MCRHLGYVGPARTLASVVRDPVHSLERQSYAPRLQQHGVVNADGFGVGWWAPEVRPEPAAYRSDRPIWADQSFASVAGVVEATCVVASVRSATPPAPSEVSGAHPFASGPWLFAHNGQVFEFRTGVGTRLRRRVSERREPSILGGSDAEVLFALVLDSLDAGADPVAALTDVIGMVESEAGGRLNFVLGDGDTLWATRAGEDLHVADRTGSGGGVWVVSEPVDDGADWREAPDRSIVEATADSLTIEFLTATA